jgi:hypothetical protein
MAGRRDGLCLDVVMVMLVMMMVVVMMMMWPGSEHRTCEHHQQQKCRKYSLHGTNPNTILIAAEGCIRPTYLKNNVGDCAEASVLQHLKK